MTKNQTKYDKIIEHYNSIDIHLASIDGRLKELNGKVARNIKDIEVNRLTTNENDDKISNLSGKVKYWGGFLAAVIIATEVIIRFVL